jgi:hypothetical protein
MSSSGLGFTSLPPLEAHLCRSPPKIVTPLGLNKKTGSVNWTTMGKKSSFVCARDVLNSCTCGLSVSYKNVTFVDWVTGVP